MNDYYRLGWGATRQVDEGYCPWCGASFTRTLETELGFTTSDEEECRSCGKPLDEEPPRVECERCGEWTPEHEDECEECGEKE